MLFVQVAEERAHKAMDDARNLKQSNVRYLTLFDFLLEVF